MTALTARTLGLVGVALCLLAGCGAPERQPEPWPEPRCGNIDFEWGAPGHGQGGGMLSLEPPSTSPYHERRRVQHRPDLDGDLLVSIVGRDATAGKAGQFVEKWVPTGASGDDVMRRAESVMRVRERLYVGRFAPGARLGTTRGYWQGRVAVVALESSWAGVWPFTRSKRPPTRAELERALGEAGSPHWGGYVWRRGNVVIWAAWARGDPGRLVALQAWDVGVVGWVFR